MMNKEAKKNYVEEMKKNFTSAEESPKANSHIVNCMFYMPFNLKDQKKKFLKKVMKFQNLSRKKLSLLVNKSKILKLDNLSMVGIDSENIDEVIQENA